MSNKTQELVEEALKSAKFESRYDSVSSLADLLLMALGNSKMYRDRVFSSAIHDLVKDKRMMRMLNQDLIRKVGSIDYTVAQSNSFSELGVNGNELRVATLIVTETTYARIIFNIDIDTSRVMSWEIDEA